MERVTISLEDDLLVEFDRVLEKKGYASRSEAIRDLIRKLIEGDRLSAGDSKFALACLSYVYSHEQRELAKRLTKAQHAHHDLVLSTLNVPIDHEDCLQITALRGPGAEVQKFAEATIAETGVRHGNLHLIPTDMSTSAHVHRDDHSHARNQAIPHLHLHLKS